MKKIMLLFSMCLVFAVTAKVPFSHATLIGPVESGSFGNVTYGATDNSINAVFAPQFGSAGNLRWTTDVNMDVIVTFNYLITPNNSLNNAYIYTDLSGNQITFLYTDGLTHNFIGDVFLSAGENLFLHAYAGNNEGNVFLSNISVSDASTATVPEPGTIMLLGAGLLGLAIYGRKRFKA